MWKVRDLSWHESRIYLTLTSFSVLPFLPLIQLLECLLGYMCGDSLVMKFSPDFHNYTGLNGLVSSFPWFAIAPPNELILGCKPHWSAKRKKTTCKNWLLGGVRQNNVSINFSKFTEQYLCDSLFITLLKVFTRQICIFLKERPHHWGFRASRLSIL